LDEIMQEARMPAPSLAFYNACFLKILKILDHAYRRAGYTVGLPCRSEIWRAVREIERIIARGTPFRTTELARQVGMSRRPFSELFRDAIGLLPNEYYQRRRVQYALPMLHDPTVPVADIALALGYSDSAYFARQFRAVQGTSPVAYRRAHEQSRASSSPD
jgi:transcriptional regulator GlxA family with amidase domain